jgi:hypothetical protein
MVTRFYGDQDSMRSVVGQGRHRDVIGGMWEEIGRLQFDFMVSQGLSPSSRMIDVGCGCLRGGVHFVRYLNPNNYFGLDANQSLLDAGYDIELADAGLQERLDRGNLVCSEDFNLQSIEGEFDFALAQSLFTHLPTNDIRLCLSRLAAKMKIGALLYATFFEAPEDLSYGDGLTHDPGGVTTFDAKDPYHYRRSDLERLCEGLPWRLNVIGDWRHPRDQRMLELRRTGEAATPPSGSTRFETIDAASRLPAGASHYRAYVGPPDRFDFMSASQFAFLFALGLRDYHRVLDFGCGSMRLIPFLRPDRYFGIEPNSWLIDDAVEHELGPSILTVKRPSFAYNDDFRCDVFGEGLKFDFIVAQSIITHCGVELTQRLIGEAGRSLAAGASSCSRS